MKHIIILILSLFMSQQSISQQTDLSILKPLTNKVWKAEGTWGDGTKFKQNITFTFDLDNNIIVTKSKGFTNKEQTAFGNRNHGIRKYDPKTKTIKFWEFDVFGGLTEGTVYAIGDDIYTQYAYGNTMVTDLWEKVDDNTYNFKVGILIDNEWKQVFLNTQFKAEKLNNN